MQKTTMALLSALGIATAGAGIAYAAGPQGMGEMMHHARGHHGGANLLETFDAIGDGQLTQAEIDAFRASRLAAFDADKDGKLSLSEYQALWLDAYRERMVDEFQRHDDDGDALVTVEEFSEPFARLVSRLDRNGDGVVTGEEMAPRRHRDISDRGERRRMHRDDDDDRGMRCDADR